MARLHVPGLFMESELLRSGETVIGSVGRGLIEIGLHTCTGLLVDARMRDGLPVEA